MAQITVSLPDELVDELREVVDKQIHYSTISDYVRDALREKLEGMNYWQRVTLISTLRNNKILQGIAKKVGATELKDWDYELSAKALEEGLVSEYRENFQGIYQEEFSVADAHFVIDVFAMYDDLQQATDRLKDKSLIDRTVFHGYDGNNHYYHLGYARFVVEDQKRFDDLRFMSKDLNSHSIVSIDRYKTMLPRWKEIRSRSNGLGRLLTKDEILEILG